MKRIGICLVVLLCIGGLFAHPHFRKEISVDLDGTKATVAYQTVPANEDLANNVAVGSFITPRAPQLSLSADMQSGSVSIPAGDYTVGVVRKADKDWSVALFKGRPARGQNVTEADVIQLDSMFSDSEVHAEHMRLDITPGHGKLEGKAVLLIEFGSLSCAGALN